MPRSSRPSPLPSLALLTSLALAGTAEAALVCPPRTIPLDRPTSGDTTGLANNAETYTCSASAFGGPGSRDGFTGGEEVWEFTLAVPATVAFSFTASNPDLHLFLLGGCDEAACLGDGGCGENLAAGTYRLVVDGWGGAEGSYLLEPIVLPVDVRNRWYDCPECPDPASCGQTPDVAGSKRWQFNSFNYCGTGCDFAMYAVVGCGTELHFPFWDGETGHMRVHDVFSGRDQDLVATNVLPVNPTVCPYTDSGTVVEWEDTGCSTIPCPGGGCGGGVDCRTNEMVFDVSMVGSPNLCGVYRIDLLDWGGWAWELYSNCTANLSEQFDVHRDLCSALVHFRSRPEVGIAGVRFDDAACPRVTGTAELENVGCAGAAGLELVIEQAPPLPPAPKVIPVTLAPGRTEVVAWDYDLTSTPAQLVFRIDPANKVPECSEDMGTSVGCGRAATLSREERLDVCTTKCASFADPGDLRVVCPGASCVLDGGGSEFRCKGQGSPEYRWEDAAGRPVPGCDWGPAATCALPPTLLPLGKSRFTLRTRCAGAPSPCEAGETTAVQVDDDAVPAALGGVLRAVRQGDDVRLGWTAEGCGASTYRVYRDADPGIAEVTRRAVATVAADAPTVFDRGAAVDAGSPEVYYQVVGVSCVGDVAGPY